MKIIVISPCLVLLDKLEDVIVIVDFDTSEWYCWSTVVMIQRETSVEIKVKLGNIIIDTIGGWLNDNTRLSHLEAR